MSVARMFDILCLAGRLVIRYPASGPGPVFRLAGRLSGIRLPQIRGTTVVRSILEQPEKTHIGCASELYRKTAHYVTPYVVPSVGVLCPRTVPSKRAFCYTFRRCVIPFGSDGSREKAHSEENRLILISS